MISVLNKREMLNFPKVSSTLVYSNANYSRKVRSHYDNLEISPNATSAEIKSAYYKLTLKYHPDRNTSVEAKDKFHAISDAYEVLSNPKTRKQYDMHGAAERGGPAGMKQGFKQSASIRRPQSSYNKKIYNFDEWNRQHYQIIFEKSQEKKQQYEAHLRYKRNLKSPDELSLQNRIVGIVCGIIILFTIYLSAKMQNYDTPVIPRKQ